ncbi:DNA polymerase III subunit alpha [Halobacillus sp. H74]|uniref:DNA polymerase III subunit alpha n=1 Tax=Halobacillus sp. H74 TaxID=3457436 RepID=UPI003FCD2F21
MTFTHLNVQSGYSLMNSTVKTRSLVQRAKELGFGAISLTDENTMSGAVSFYQECNNQGVKPIIGLKTTVEDRSLLFPVIMLAKNSQGYRNLLKITTYVQTNATNISLEELGSRKDGLIVIQMTASSPWADTIANRMFSRIDDSLIRWLDMFGEDHFYMSIQDRDLHAERQMHQPLQEWVESKGIRVVAIGDVRYLHSEDAAAYQCLRAIDEGARYSPQVNRSYQYLKSGEEIENFFGEWWPEVLSATQEIVESCNLELNLNQQLLPAYPTPYGETPDAYLQDLCEKALVKKFGSEDEKAVERLRHELNVIQSMQFSDYFLIVWDFISYARKQGIHAGPGRGSAAGSIVAYLLDITQVDPLKYGLLFERFLNPERVTMPDIDIDFPDYRRDEVIAYVSEKYGKDHVAQISTFGTFAARSVLRELFKVLAVDESDASFILYQIPKNTSDTLIEIVKKSEELKDYIRNSDQLQFLFKIATKLEGLPRHVSTHAAGVVLSEEPLTEYTPLMNGQGNVHLTQMAMGDLEKIGLLKIDFLGLRNLSFIEKLENTIRKYSKQKFSVKDLPLNDGKTFDLLKQGRTNGVFQLESKGMKGVLTRLKPSHFEDVVAVNALYRPGPMDYIQAYIKRKHGNMEYGFPHPDLKGILGPTFGVLIYQEQIMQVARQVAGYSLGEADLLRRAISKKQGDIWSNERDKFIAGCKKKGYEESVATELFDWIVKFSNYGFNRSHAVAYSLISYWLAFIKAHYPSHFLAELMNANIGDRDKGTIYIREAREMNVKVNAPSINRSHILTRDDRGEIRMGLLAIKGLGYQAAQAIVDERVDGPYKSLNDFCLRLDDKAVSRSVIEALIISGAFDELHQNRASSLASIDQALEQGELFKEFQDQPGFFGTDIEMGMVEVDPFPPLKELSMEKEVLGAYMSEHPLGHHRNALRSRGMISLYQADQLKSKRKLVTAVVLESFREIRTKRGDSMSFVTISDETAEMEAVLFPEAYRNVKPWLKEQMLVIAEGKIEERNNRKQMIINQLKPFELSERENKAERRLFVKVTKDTEHTAIDKLKEAAEYFPGNTPVLIFRSEDRKIYHLDQGYSLEISRECLNMLNDFFGSQSVALRTQDKHMDV